MLTSASIHVFYTFVRVWVTEALFTNHKLECCQTSLAKSTLLKNAQRKRNLFWRIFLCLPSPARAEYAIILQPNYKLEQRPAEGNQLHQQAYSRKTFRESTTEYFNALRVLKLEVLVRITKIKTRLDHTLTCKMHTSASSHGSYTFVRVWVTEAFLLIIHVNVPKLLSRNRRHSNTRNGNAIASEELVSVCPIKRRQSTP